MDLGKEILKAMQIMINRKFKNYKADRTYESVIKYVTKKGYIVLDRTGSERTVQCCMPNIQLRPTQRVWVKEPMGDLNKIHIVGLIESTSNSGRKR